MPKYNSIWLRKHSLLTLFQLLLAHIHPGPVIIPTLDVLIKLKSTTCFFQLSLRKKFLNEFSE